MVSAMREISKLRDGKLFEVDPRNRNRYRLLVKENVGTTAYCFSTPIYNNDSRKLVYRCFEEKGDAFVFTGSNATVIAYKSQIVLKNAEGSASVCLPLDNLTLCENNLCTDGWEIHPTFNGVLISANSPSVRMKIRVDKHFHSIRHCTKSFAIMQEEFRPFLTLSPLWATDEQGKAFPTEVAYEQVDQYTYEVEVRAIEGDTITFEVNLYEPKLFQDTTVESARPDENNAFGGIAFLGRNKWVGEQWLYARPDFSKIPELYSVYVKKVLLHLPCPYTTGTKLSVFAPVARFCSFGSTWNNKIAEIPKSAIASEQNGYVTVDLTDILTDPVERRMLYTEGLILKPTGTGDGFTAISTGDNYGLPQILEVQYE